MNSTISAGTKGTNATRLLCQICARPLTAARQISESKIREGLVHQCHVHFGALSGHVWLILVKIARWQNLIPSFHGLRWGGGQGTQSKERKGSNFASQRSPNAYNLKIWVSPSGNLAIDEPSWHQGPGEEGAALCPRHVHHGGRLHALLGALWHRLFSEWA